MDHPKLKEIRELIEPILAQSKIELVELTCRLQNRQWLIRLLVDTVGGVTIQQCASMNRLIGEALEQVDLIEESYTIEVSSPGLDRPLVTQRDYERAVGEDLKLNVEFEEGKRKELQGMLLAVQPEAIVLQTTSGNLTVPIAQIQTAKKALKW